MPDLHYSAKGRAGLPAVSPLKVPHCRVTTWNACSLSLHRSDPQGRQRRVKVLACITRLLGRCDVLCLQESRLGKNDTSSLSHYFPNHIVYYENDILGHGGVVTLVDRKFGARYDIEQIRLGGAAHGRILPLVFSLRNPLPSDPATPPLCITNVYLTSSATTTVREAEFVVLGQLERTHRHIVCGDFNFVEDPEDAPSAHSAVTLSPHLTDKWAELVLGLGLREIAQPTHTRYSFTDSLTTTSTSRIDRIYVSHSEAELAILPPTTYIPYLGMCSALSSLSKRTARSPDTTGPRLVNNFISDHIPVGIIFRSTTPPPKKTFSLPKWFGDIPGVAKDIESRWGGPREGEDPYLALKRWKKAALNSFRAFKLSDKSREKVFGGELGIIAIGTYILRVAKTAKVDLPHLRSLLNNAPTLKPLVAINPSGLVDTTDLEKHLSDLITDNASSLSEDDPHSYTDYMPYKSNKTDPISRVRALLPSSRSRITLLRARLEDEPTDDPQVMGDITQAYYGEVWRKNHNLPNYDSMCSYVSKRLKTVPPELQPEPVTADLFAEVIEGSNNSCSGPSGIPFSGYRAYLREDFRIAELGAAIVNSMGSGSLPPVGFNYGRLFILPKDDSCTIDKTRPISVTDSFNRLVATCMVRVLTPAFDYLIGDWQRGFVGGRVGTDHVHSLTGDFYRKLNMRQQHHVLLLDIKRAFDSVAHSFIHAVLETIGLDLWARLVIKGLLHVIRVIPQLAMATDHCIRIGRGVKQGCPLSPLLFVLCFECLLVGIAANRCLRTYAFADDLAVATRSVTLLLATLQLVREFSNYSDLRPNIAKTLIVSTRPPSTHTKDRLTAAGWGGIKFADEAVYLGVLFGRRVSTVDVFRAAFGKFKKRVAIFRPALRRMSIHLRIFTFNVFLLPLFYYLGQFLLIPYQQVVVPVKEICRKCIIPFGSGFAYPHLITPRGSGLGPHTPLRDLWSFNMALLGSPFPIELSDGLQFAQLGEWEWVNRFNGLDSSLDPAAHSAYAAWAFLYDYAKRDRHRGMAINLEGLPGPSKASRRRGWIYRRLAIAGYEGPRSSLESKTSVGRRLSKLLDSPPSAETERSVSQHLRLTGRFVSPARWNLHLRLAFRCLPFDERRKQARMQVEPRPALGVLSPFPCYACGGGTDSAGHLYSDCRVVRKARDMVSELTGTTLRHDMRSIILAFPPTDNPTASILTLTFNYQVWVFRSFCRSLARRPPFVRAARRLANATMANMPGGVRKDPAGERALQLALSPPPHVVAVFTDGSALGNPGPAGAGIWLRGPGVPEELHAVALGQGDNNDAEMQAIRIGLGRATALAGRFAEGAAAKIPLLLFSDSLGCLGYLLEGWKTAVERRLARATKAAYRTCKEDFEVALIWVRGHAQIPGNELADEQAKKGAKRARDTRLQRPAHELSIGVDAPT